MSSLIRSARYVSIATRSAWELEYHLLLALDLDLLPVGDYRDAEVATMEFNRCSRVATSA
jgi:hypothetical protein